MASFHERVCSFVFAFVFAFHDPSAIFHNINRLFCAVARSLCITFMATELIGRFVAGNSSVNACFLLCSSAVSFFFDTMLLSAESKCVVC